jgi:hypothetical protein
MATVAYGGDLKLFWSFNILHRNIVFSDLVWPIWFRINLIPILTDSKPIWFWTYLIPNQSNSPPVSFQTYLILDLSDFELFWFRTYSIWFRTYLIPNLSGLILNLSDFKSIRFRTFLTPNRSDSEPIWFGTHLKTEPIRYQTRGLVEWADPSPPSVLRRLPTPHSALWWK